MPRWRRGRGVLRLESLALDFGDLGGRMRTTEKEDAPMKRMISLLALVTIAAACSSIPSVPTAPRLGQTPALMEADEKACASAATEPRKLSYAACMIARGYTVTATIPGP